MQRNTLVLRYGIGPLQARSGRETARLLDVSRARVRLLESRGVRALNVIDRGAACEDTGVARTTLLALYDLLVGGAPSGGYESLPAPLEAGARLADAATVALDEGGRAEVAGVRESGGGRRDAAPSPEEDGPVWSAGPSLGNPFRDVGSPFDNPLFLVLLAIVVACLASAAREIRRAVR